MDKLIVTIDAGHGIEYQGKMSPILETDMYIGDGACVMERAGGLRFCEYKFNRVIANKLLDKLANEAWIDMTLINKGDNDMSLGNRKYLVNQINPDLHVSIHANAIGYGQNWEQAKGFSIWTSRGRTKSDEYAEIIYNNFADFFKNEINMLKDMSDGDVDYESNFSMLMVNCPAVLLETAFYTSKEDVQTLMNPTFQDNYVSCLKNAFIDIRELQ